MDQTTPSTHNAPAQATGRRAGRRPSGSASPAGPQRHHPVQVRASFRRLVRAASIGPAPASTLN